MNKIFTKFSNSCSDYMGRPVTFVLNIIIVIIWLSFGIYLEFSSLYLLIFNTILSVITYLMIFVVQNSQNTNDFALHAKLDEILRQTPSATSNLLVETEKLTLEELQEIKQKIVGLEETNKK